MFRPNAHIVLPPPVIEYYKKTGACRKILAEFYHFVKIFYFLCNIIKEEINKPDTKRVSQGKTLQTL